MRLKTNLQFLVVTQDARDQRRQLIDRERGVHLVAESGDVARQPVNQRDSNGALLRMVAKRDVAGGAVPENAADVSEYLQPRCISLRCALEDLAQVHSRVWVDARSYLIANFDSAPGAACLARLKLWIELLQGGEKVSVVRLRVTHQRGLNGDYSGHAWNFVEADNHFGHNGKV